MRDGRRWLTALGMALLAIGLSYPVSWAQTQVKNYFDPCAGGASTPCDNIFNVSGTQEIESAGVVDFKTGAVVKDAGTDVTTDFRAVLGAGLNATELGFIDGVTAGTTAASKAVVMGSDSKVNTFDSTILKANGVTITNAAIGVAASYKIARGATALDGTNPTPVAHGLTTVVACTVALNTAVAPGAGTSVVTYDVSGTDLQLHGWKATTGGAAGNADLVASSGTETIGWICVGT